jgi:hypothetical protein
LLMFLMVDPFLAYFPFFSFTFSVAPAGGFHASSNFDSAGPKIITDLTVLGVVRL